MNEYSQLIQKLFRVNLFGGVKLGLCNMLRLQDALGFPERQYEIIHVAGTNGKGSVTRKIAAALEYAGYRVGQYTSPHISSFRERICINGAMIAEAEVEALLKYLFAIIEREKIPATFFEITTAIALKYFADRAVDIAVLETGLGGRLDATNCVTPKLSVITSISLEHMDVLGPTVEHIAREKAGIIKEGIPVVLGPRMPQALMQEIAASLHSPCTSLKDAYLNFQDENNAIAEAALKVLHIENSATLKGLEAQLPCRLDVCYSSVLSYSVIFDVAHNPDGLEHLFQAIKQKWPHNPIRAICGLSKTKDLTACLSILKQHVSHIHFVEAPNRRGAASSELHRIFISLGGLPSKSSFGALIAETVMHAAACARQSGELLLVCGTFFIMSEARVACGIEESIDAVDLN